MRSEKALSAIIALICSFAVGPTPASSQQFTKFDRDRARDMLQDIASDVRKHYYDPKFHGLNWEAKVQEAKEKISTAETLNLAFSQVAAALYSLNDSHTFFLPPPRPYRHDYGYQTQLVGDRCYVIRVRPHSDGEAKGVKAGDELLSVNGFVPARDNLWTIGYVFGVLRPQKSLRLTLRDTAGVQHEVEVLAKMKELKRVLNFATGETGGSDIWDAIRESENEERLMRIRSSEVKDDLLIVKFPNFMSSEGDIDSLVSRVRNHKALILDLRGNPGGSVEILKRFLGAMFDKEVKIGDRIGRDFNKPMMTKSHGGAFTGKVIVLVDSRSASAAELFARVVQIEKRGVVIGDHTSGSVMESRRYTYHIGQGTTMYFGASITDADIVMTDGKSLEHSGVSPDDVVLPTAADLASGRDPVLAHAAESVGIHISPQQAGAMFPYEWAKD